MTTAYQFGMKECTAVGLAMMKLMNLLAISNFTRLMNLPCPLQSAKIFCLYIGPLVCHFLELGTPARQNINAKQTSVFSFGQEQ
jgi:hypothetical protein